MSNDNSQIDWPDLVVPANATPEQMIRAFAGHLLMRQRTHLACAGTRQERQEAAACAHELARIGAYWLGAKIVAGDGKGAD